MNNLPATLPIDQTHRLQEKAAPMEHLQRIAAEIKANMPDGVTSDHGWLYGKDGRPA